MGKSSLYIMLVIMLVAFPAHGQEDRPLIQLNPFSIEGIGPEESGLIVSLVKSYLSDIGHLMGYPPLYTETSRNNTGYRRPSQNQNHSADITINGSIRNERDGTRFILDITDTRTGENFSVSSTYRNSGEIALRTRSVLESAFPGGFESGNRVLVPEEITEQFIVGMWKGETGIEIIRLMQGGRGSAIFTSGVQMVVSWEIQGNNLRISQLSPNSERYYHPLPYEAARRLAAGAEPMYWELSMYQGGTVLGGMRVSTAARIINGKFMGLLPGGDVREVTWTKLGP
jgi:hypothetical protein